MNDVSGLSVLVIQHLPHEDAGLLGQVMDQAGITPDVWQAWTDRAVPDDPWKYDAVVALGGDMNTDDDADWPHLPDVRRLLGDAVRHDVPVLGLCLGAQLLAEATGGSVTHGRPEIGYVPIHRTPAGHCHPVVSAVADHTPFFNAHGDYITPPPGATVLAHSSRTPVHAFSLGSALALQYHPEVDATVVAGYVKAPGVAAYLTANGWTPEALSAAARSHDDAHRASGTTLFTAWLAGLTAPAKQSR